jgi:hypothetical protein
MLIIEPRLNTVYIHIREALSCFQVTWFYIGKWLKCMPLHTYKKRRGKKNYAGGENHSPHQLRKRSHFGTKYCKAPHPPKGGKEISMGIRRVAGLA